MTRRAIAAPQSSETRGGTLAPRPQPSTSSELLVRSEQEAEVRETLGKFLMCNPKAVPPESVEPWANALCRFPALEVRAALATATADSFIGIQLDRVLRVLGTRLWKESGLPPPTEVALAEIERNAVYGRTQWSHAAIQATAQRYGFRALFEEDSRPAGVRAAELRRIYEEERERAISAWIATISQ